MHRIKVTSSVLCRRLYGIRVRNDIFGSRGKSGGLIMNQEGLGRVLWKYFNAPGNVMFVTVNLVTFAGIVTYNSMVSANQERFFEERMLMAQETLTPKYSCSEEKKPLEKEIESPQTGDVVKICSPAPEQVLDVQPLTEYKAETLILGKESKCASYDSQMAKMSLYHMMYAYFLCRQVASNEGSKTSKPWDEEVELLKSTTHSGNVNSRTKNFMETFYKSWKTEFIEVFTDLHKSQQFHFPDWKHYPSSLRYVCKTLYHNDMQTIEDFQNFYDSIGQRDLKRLLRLWLCDHSHLVSPANGYNVEKFYRELIADCHNDDYLLNKYSSMLLNPTDPRKSLFFSKYGKYATQKVPSASIDTVLSVLQEYVALQETQGRYHYNAIVRLISMIRRDCVIARTTSGTTRIRQVRVLLPRDEDRERIDLTANKNERKKCFQLVSHNPKAVELLGIISSWQNTKS